MARLKQGCRVASRHVTMLYCPLTFPGRWMPAQTLDSMVASFRTASKSRSTDCRGQAGFGFAAHTKHTGLNRGSNLQTAAWAKGGHVQRFSPPLSPA